jgi:fibronectin-binding autotransporter adhesin
MKSQKLLALVILVSSVMATNVLATQYIYTPNNGTSDTWSTGSDWSGSVAPVSAATTQLTFVQTNTTVQANSLTNTNTNDIASPPFQLNIMDLQGTGPASGLGSITIAGNQLSFVSNGATTPVINLNALNGTAGLTYTVQNNLALTNNTTFTGNGTAAFNFSGILSGAGTLTKSGTSTLTLSGANTFTGATTINAGILSINSIQNAGSNSALGAPTGTNAIITLNGGTLQFTGSSAGSSSRGMALTASSALDASGSTPFALSGAITNSGNNVNTLTLTGSGIGTESGAIGTSTTKLSTLAKSGSGMWTLSNNVFVNTSMTVNTNGGTLEAANGSALFAGGTGSWIPSKIIVKSGGTLAFGVGTGGFTTTPGGQLDTLNTALVAGGTGSGGFENGSFLGLDTTGGSTSYNTAITNNSVGGVIGLTKLGINTLTLGGTNTYTGATTVSAGTLAISGSTAAGSAVSVKSGATLIATGTVGGTVAVANGATLSGAGSTGAATISGGGNINLMDNAIGILTVGGLTSGGATASSFTFEIGTGGTADTIATTALALGANTTDITIDNLNNAGSQTITNGTYNLITYSTLSSGALGNFSLTDGTLDGHTLVLTSLASGDLVLTVSGGAGGAPAQAYWSGTTGTSWGTTTNFNTSATSGTAVTSLPGSSTDVVFSTSSPIAGNLGTTLDAARVINSLTFNSTSGNVTIASGTGGGSSTLTINAATTTGSGGINTAPNGIAVQSGAGTVGISAPVILGANQTWSNAGSNLLTVSGGVTGTADLALQANSTGDITLSGGSVNPTGSIANSGTGSGTTTISSVIGSNVSTVTQNSSSSTLVLASGNNYTGGTTVSAGKLLLTNGTSGSATGTGSTLSVGSSGTIGGIGTSNSTSFNIAGNVIAGSGIATDTTGQTVIAGAAVLHNSTFANATLSFNLNSANQNSTTIGVGSTGVDFGNTTLSLTLQGNSSIAANTPYLLIQGINSGSLTGIDGSQYSGFTTDASGADGLAAGQYKILTGMSLNFTNDGGAYSANSFLFLNTVGGVDDIEVEVVPEPSTWALILGGLAVLVFWQRRKCARP